MHKLIGLIGVALLLATSSTWADSVERFNGYLIHFNAFNADLLDQRVAQAYKLRSGCHDGVITVAVRKDDGSPVAADIKAQTITLVGQRNAVTMKEVRDGKSVYYVGSFPLGAGAEPLKFSVQLRPEGESREHRFEFTRQLFRC